LPPVDIILAALPTSSEVSASGGMALSGRTVTERVAFTQKYPRH